MIEWLKAVGIAGFLFFLIKGLLWLLVFRLVAKGVIKKESIERLKKLFSFRKTL